MGGVGPRDCEHRLLTVVAWLGITLLTLASARLGQPGAFPAAPVQRAYELIDEVNALRASYGLGAYEIDPILMAVAQTQNDWRVSAGVTTHLGPDGSRPRERAIAAGYGGGATVFISENIADGLGLTPAEAVSWWTGDDPHLNTMIGANYRHVGAGAGESGGVWRYTLMAGYVVGGSYDPGSVPASSPVPPVSSYRAPFILSTPGRDGSIVHIVQAGQSLWTIAAMYEVDLDELRRMNGLPQNPLLHAGDEILVRPANTPTPGPALTETTAPTSSPTTPPSPRPTSTQIWASPTPTVAPESPTGRPLRWILFAVGGLMIAVGVAAGLRARGSK